MNENKLKIDKKWRLMKLMNKQSKITLQQFLEQKFGRDQVKVVKWKWTPEQLEQLKDKK